MPVSPGVSPHLASVARGLGVDGLTAEVVRAFKRAGVDSILLKGPAIERLLYTAEPRAYVDADLLVPPDAIEQAERLLAAAGFEEGPISRLPELGLPHARPWIRREDNGTVDLHALIAGVGVGPRKLWDVLSPLTEPFSVANTECRVLVPHALLLVAALHAAQHGDHPKPLDDLRRAVATASEDEWRKAAELADRLDAIVNFTSALRSLPEGAHLADRLGLPSAQLVDASRGADSPTRLALGFERLAAAGGWRERLVGVVREIAPSPEHMRWWSPLARRGRLGLGAAYAWRFIQLVRLTPAGLVAWRRARGS